MRLLFSFAGGNGHFEPMVPLARAAESAGHTVAFVASPRMRSTVEAGGFTFLAAGAGSDEPPRRVPLRELSAEREDRVLREAIAGHVARERVAYLLAAWAEWRPDLLVCAETDFGSMVAAELLGEPFATVLIIAAGSFVRPAVVAEPLDALRAEHGLPADPGLAMPGRHLVLSPFPPSFRDPAFPLPATAHSFRPPLTDPRPYADPPAWLANLDGAPTVYVTLGTVFNLESGDLFSRVIEGVRELPVRVIVTVGLGIDPRELGPQPGNVHVEPYIPQSLVLPHCDVVVSHGGSGSVMGALAHGLPLVCIPMGADQPHNAARCEDLGVAEVLGAVAATPQSVREAVSRVLARPGYRQGAERLRDEIAALPGPEHAVALLERLATERATEPGP